MIAVRSADERRLSGGESSVGDEVVAVEDEILEAKRRAEARQSPTGSRENAQKYLGFYISLPWTLRTGIWLRKRNFESSKKKEVSKNISRSTIE